MKNNFEIYCQILKDNLNLTVFSILNMIKNKKLKNYCIYISFDKYCENNKIPDCEDSEDYTTIVLENNFWNLKIDKKGFSVDLEIDDEDEHFYITFDSIVLISDHKSDFILDFRPIHNIAESLNDKDSKIIFVEV